MNKPVWRIVGCLGLLASVVLYVLFPSFPTPDKLLPILLFIGLIIGQPWELLKRFVPFVVLLLVYDSFRGLADQLNTHVHYTFMPTADKWLFAGHLPTAVLQSWWWHGHVQWYDLMFYGVYLLHFVLPLGLGLLIWRLKDSHYWQFVTAFVLVSFAGFVTYAIFPAAPPWIATQMGLIQPIAHIADKIFHAVGIHDAAVVYNKISPNPVAAMPSLHAAYATLSALFVTRLFKTRWRLLVWAHPILIWVGTVYFGEHYVIDAIAGVLYAVVAYIAAPYVLRYIKEAWVQASKIFKKAVA